MQYYGLPRGIYLAKRRSDDKPVDHYGACDIGNVSGQPYIDGSVPIIVHLTGDGVRVHWWDDDWTIIGRTPNLAAAIQRFRAAWRPQYRLFTCNCEHFARYLVYGKVESFQVQTGVILTGAAAALTLALRDDETES